MNPLVVPAFTMGLFGGLHCATMCGSASSVLCAGKGRHSLVFNVGRGAGYVVLGAVAGALGSWAVGHGIDGIRLAFRVLAATTMSMVGLHLAGLPSFLRVFERAGAPVWRRVAPIAARLVPIRSAWHALAAGALWSLMPCGLLYAALAMSASGYSVWDGVTTMAAFAGATMPVMLGVGALGARLAPLARTGWLRRAMGVGILAFGLWSTAGVAKQVLFSPLASCH